MKLINLKEYFTFSKTAENMSMYYIYNCDCTYVTFCKTIHLEVLKYFEILLSNKITFYKVSFSINLDCWSNL